MGTYRTDPSDLSESQIEQLREIQRNRRKQSLRGIGREVEGFIGRLLENSARLKFWNLEGHLLGQLRLLYMMGWGETVKAATFEEYLSGIPEIPEQFLAADERFPHLVLVDKRPGLKRCCLLARLRSGVDTDFEIVPFDQEKPIKDSVYWIRANDGRQNQNRNLLDCREFFVKTGDEIGLEIGEAVAV